MVNTTRTTYKRLLQPQEIEVYYILPTIRRYLAFFMKEKGVRQHKIAELLQLQEAAISQYLNNKRGNQIDFEEDIKDEIRKSADRIKNSTTLLGETQRLLKLVREKRVLCKVHKLITKGVPSECDPGKTGCSEIVVEGPDGSRICY